MLDRWTRIWWVRPGSDADFQQREAARSGRRTRYSDQAARPSASRAVMRVRWTGSRAMGRSMRPLSCSHAAVHQRQVDLLHLPAGKLRGQVAVRRVVLGHQQHAAGVAVQAVDDARPQRPAHARKRGRSGAAGRSPGCRNGRPRRRGPPCRRACRRPPGRRPHRATDERDVFRGGPQRRRVGGVHVHGLAAAHRSRGARGSAVHQHAPALDPLLNARPAELRQALVEHLVQTACRRRRARAERSMAAAAHRFNRAIPFLGRRECGWRCSRRRRRSGASRRRS